MQSIARNMNPLIRIWMLFCAAALSSHVRSSYCASPERQGNPRPALAKMLRDFSASYGRSRSLQTAGRFVKQAWKPDV